VKVQDLSNADKYLLLGNLLREFSSESSSRKALEIVKSRASLEEKLLEVLKLYRSDRNTDRLTPHSVRQKPPFPAAETRSSPTEAAQSPSTAAQLIRSQRGKPRVLILDPRSEISRVLSSSQLADSYAFIHAEAISGQADRLKRYRPRVVIMNADEEITTTLELSRELTENQTGVDVIILCTKSQHKEALQADRGWEHTYLVSKPLNLMHLTDVLQQAVAQP
jgi:PleD family two-component response regulator